MVELRAVGSVRIEEPALARGEQRADHTFTECYGPHVVFVELGPEGGRADVRAGHSIVLDTEFGQLPRLGRKIARNDWRNLITVSSGPRWVRRARMTKPLLSTSRSGESKNTTWQSWAFITSRPSKVPSGDTQTPQQ